MKKLLLLFAVSIPLCAAAQSVRLVLQVDSVRNVNGAEIDSSFFSYSSGRGSDVDSGFYNFDSCYIARHCTSCLTTRDEILLKTYDGANNLTRFTQKVKNSNNIWHTQSVTDYFYDANYNLILKTATDSNAVLSYRDSFNYDANNNLESSIVTSYNSLGTASTSGAFYSNITNGLPQDIFSFYWNNTTNAWINSTHRSLAYNPASQIVYDYFEHWNGTTWESQSFITNGYNGNDLVSWLYQNWNGSIWMNSLSDTIVYINGEKSFSINQAWSGLQNAWIKFGVDSFTYDTAGNQIRHVVYSNWSNSMNRYQYGQDSLSVYNAYHQPVLRAYKSWNDFQGQWGWPGNGILWSKYFYESYTPAHIPDVAAASCQIQLFPVPASDLLHLEITTETPQPAIISLYSASGDLALQWKANDISHLHKVISLAHLANGSYVLVVKAKTFSQAKHLVVQH
jgi:hypothetical protein